MLWVKVHRPLPQTLHPPIPAESGVVSSLMPSPSSSPRMSTKSLCDCPNGSLQNLTCWPSTMPVESANSSHLSAAQLPSNTSLPESLRQPLPCSPQQQVRCMRLHHLGMLDLVPRPAFPWRHCLPSSRAFLAQALRTLSTRHQYTTGGCFPPADFHIGGCLHGALHLISAEPYVAADAECIFAHTAWFSLHCLSLL